MALASTHPDDVLRMWRERPQSERTHTREHHTREDPKRRDIRKRIDPEKKRKKRVVRRKGCEVLGRRPRRKRAWKTALGSGGSQSQVRAGECRESESRVKRPGKEAGPPRVQRKRESPRPLQVS